MRKFILAFFVVPLAFPYLSFGQWKQIELATTAPAPWQAQIPKHFFAEAEGPRLGIKQGSLRMAAMPEIEIQIEQPPAGMPVALYSGIDNGLLPMPQKKYEMGAAGEGSFIASLPQDSETQSNELPQPGLAELPLTNDADDNYVPPIALFFAILTGSFGFILVYRRSTANAG